MCRRRVFANEPRFRGPSRASACHERAGAARFDDRQWALLFQGPARIVVDSASGRVRVDVEVNVTVTAGRTRRPSQRHLSPQVNVQLFYDIYRIYNQFKRKRDVLLYHSYIVITILRDVLTLDDLPISKPNVSKIFEIN